MISGPFPKPVCTRYFPDIVPECFRRSGAVSTVEKGFRGHHLTPLPLPPPQSAFCAQSLTEGNKAQGSITAPETLESTPHMYVDLQLLLGTCIGDNTGIVRGQPGASEETGVLKP